MLASAGAWGGHARKGGEGYGVGNGRESIGVGREYICERGRRGNVYWEVRERRVRGWWRLREWVMVHFILSYLHLGREKHE